MTRTGQLEARVDALEEEVARLKTVIDSRQGVSKPWWEHIAGTFVQDHLYKTAMTLGRQHRRSQRRISSGRRRSDHDRARH